MLRFVLHWNASALFSSTLLLIFEDNDPANAFDISCERNVGKHEYILEVLLLNVLEWHGIDSINNRRLSNCQDVCVCVFM